VQIDPVKPTLKAPGTECLKPEYEGLLSNFGFKFNLRRYTKVQKSCTPVTPGEITVLVTGSAGRAGPP
jgi:hypothetical protein